MIQLKHIHKRYAQDSFALSDINLEIKQGEIFGIIGRSGAGKSTLVRCMNLLEMPTQGQVILEGSDLTALSLRALRKARLSIGMIFQHFNLLSSRTVFKNVALPLELIGTKKADIIKKVNHLLELVGLLEHKNQLPNQLSGGQMQRVAIARALASDPKVLLCDEATSALDPETTQSILTLLKEINQRLKLTIVMITHSMDVIKNICDRVAVLEKGQVVEQGPVLDIFTEPKAQVTKSLTQSALHVELPERISENLKASYEPGLNPLIRLAFIGHSSEEPLLVTLQQKFNVIVNFLQADLEFIQDCQVGIAICQFIGEPSAIESSLKYLTENNIKVEVIGYE